MADRALFDNTSAIPKGRYQARINLDRAGISPGRLERTGNPIPLARVGRGGFEAESGGAALQAARGMGMKTAPVAMSMSSWRKAGAAGMIAKPAFDPDFGNYSRKQEIRNFGASAQVGIVVDLTDMWRLAKGFTGIATAIRNGHSIIDTAINDGLRTLKTGVRRKLVAWTGIKSYAETERGMKLIYAAGGSMTGALRITDRHRRIGKNFGAAWSRSNPGGTHSAWNRSQMAAGSFMARGILFRRVGKGRHPIAPLWGPNMAREVERHEAEVQADVMIVAKAKVETAAVRLMAMAIAKAK